MTYDGGVIIALMDYQLCQGHGRGINRLEVKR